MEKKKRGASWVGALVVVAVLCVGAFFVARNIAGSRSSQLRTATLTPAYSGQTVRTLGDGIIYYDNASLHALDSSGKQIWSYAAGSNAGFSVGSGGVATWTGSILSILGADQGQSLFSGTLDGTILDARVGTVYAAIQMGEEQDSSILILDSSGRQVENISMDGQTVLDFGFFNNDSLLWVMTLNTDGTVPMSTITTYRPGKMLLGAVEDNQQVLYEVVFQASQIRAVGTTHIKDYDYYGKEITDNRILVYGWYLMSIDEDAANPLMAFVPIGQSDGIAGISDVRMIRGQIDQSVHLPYPASWVLAVEDAIYALTNQYVMVCHMGESVPTTYVLPIYVDGVLGITDNKTCVATSGGYVYLIPLP